METKKIGKVEFRKIVMERMTEEENTEYCKMLQLAAKTYNKFPELEKFNTVEALRMVKDLILTWED